MYVLYYVMCFQLHPLADPGINYTSMKITRVGYTRLDTDSLFYHFCMTIVHEAKWLASTKKAGPSIRTQPVLPIFYL